MLTRDQERQIIAFINAEAERMQFGHLYVDLTLTNGKATNIQAETKRSENINR